MMDEIFPPFVYLIIFATAFLVNIPCGYIRENHPKFSFKWLFWIHASIPLLIYLRLSAEASPFSIPFTIVFAVAGQIIGSRTRRRTQTPEDVEKIWEISDLKLPSPEPVADVQVMVALLNMGGPRRNRDVPDFQKHLFNDKLLIRFPLSFFFQRLFAWLLVKFRSKAVAELYREMGLPSGGSPIYRSTTAQAQALRQELNRRGRDIAVTFSFNYSPPFPEQTVRKAKRDLKKYLLPLSLYPHYSSATTGSNLHYLKKARDKVFPDLKILPSPLYYLHPGYIDAFVDRIHESLKPEESLDDFYLIFSAHGLPKYFLREGDLYPFQISQTVSAILSRLGRTHRWVISYQSAVGPLEWLKPATDDTIKALARRNVKKLMVIPVAFVGDHIETTIEINMEYRKLAEELEIEDYRMPKAIETHPGFIRALADSVEEQIVRPEEAPKRHRQQKAETTAAH